ncbi:hypothetical protein [Roseateles aquatilis]|uniref:hypothetical protein n=1 Tax=Roseateles aquatilis TaxID=431061 RepID=UPI0011302EBC|nr:hypothetical protein [Roseateles aquatilis]
MSIRAVTAVIASSLKPPTVKLTAVVLADALNERTGQLNLSLASIAERVGISRDQARRCVRTLLECQVLSIVANAAGGAPGLAPHYRLHFDRLTTLRETDGTGATPTGGTGATPPSEANAPDGLHPCNEGVAPMQPTGGTGATRTRRNRKEPEERGVSRRDEHAPRRRIEETTLAEWLTGEAAAGRKAVPGDDAIFNWSERVGLPPEFLALAWDVFKDRYTPDPASPEKPKTYVDWRAVFRRAVKEDWLKLWMFQGNEYLLTTRGLQARRAQLSNVIAESRGPDDQPVVLERTAT